MRGRETALAASPVLTSDIAKGTERCRCGNRLPAGSTMIVFQGLSGPVGALVKDLRFCSTTCVRSYLLEALELFLGSNAASVVTDTNEVLTELGRIYAMVHTLAR